MSVYVWLIGHWGARLNVAGIPLYLDAPPFKGTWRTGLFTFEWPSLWTPALLAAIALAFLVPLWWVKATVRLEFRWVLVGSWLFSLAWTLAVGGTSAPVDYARPLLNTHHEYLVFSREITSPTQFVSGFLQHLSSYPTHVRGHPPGAVLSFWGLDKLFPNNTGFALALLAIAATAAPATLLAVRALRDESAARRVAVFAGLMPAVVWIGTSADALLMAVVAWAVAAAVIGLAADGTSARLLTFISGVAAGVALTLSYGSLILLAPLGAISVWLVLKRRFVDTALLVLGATLAPLALVAMGFNWIDGYHAVRFQYYDGVASERPQWYFAYSNLAAFSVAIGPAAVAGLSTLRDRRLWVLTGSALGAIALADISGMSKGEVERIWLPAVPWVLIATESLRTTRTRRIWASVTMAFTILLQWKLRAAW